MLFERIFPGRDLPNSPQWYLRAAFFNTCQLGIILLAGITWSLWFSQLSLMSIASLPGFLQGFIAWFIGTFVFYWWHRARHESSLLWKALHQIHHSPTRIETLTAFYKHPLEIATDSIISSAIVYLLLGASAEGTGWYYLFAASSEVFYHANIATPAWLGYFIQRPEHHSIHHQLGLHKYNYADVTWWDRLFGTFREAESFAQKCGFPKQHELKIPQMMVFKDVYELTGTIDPPLLPLSEEPNSFGVFGFPKPNTSMPALVPFKYKRGISFGSFWPVA